VIATALDISPTAAKYLRDQLKAMGVIVCHGNGRGSWFEVVDPTGEITPERVQTAFQPVNQRIYRHRSQAITPLQRARTELIHDAMVKNDGAGLQIREIVESLGFNTSTVKLPLRTLRVQGVYENCPGGRYRLSNRQSKVA
jgi:hypothetical protein